MENFKNFIGSVIVNGSGNSSNSNRPPSNTSVPSAMDQSQQKSNTIAGVGAGGTPLNYGKTTIRNRTESECSNVSLSSTSSFENNANSNSSSSFDRPPNASQKDKDSYFWVMWHS